MSTVRRGTSKSDPVASAPAPASTAPSVASHRATLFPSAATVESKKRPRDFFSSYFPIEPVRDQISSFLGFQEKGHLLQLNKKLRAPLLDDPLFKQGWIKQLLFALVGAYQQPHPQYSPKDAESLLKGALKLTELNPVERRLALAVSGKLPEAKEALDEAFNRAFQSPLKQALAKGLLLALIRAYQRPKAEAILNGFPPFLNSDEYRLDYLFALMVSGYQNEAETWLERYPELLLEEGSVVDHDGEVFPDITPYQWTLCLKHTQMRLMIRKKLPLEQAALQAEEFELGKNPGIEALKQKYIKRIESTRKAYRFYCQHYDPWTPDQCRDYWSLVIGGQIQSDWPDHWMRELFYPGREFNVKTDFSSAETLQALPEAQYGNGEAFYPWSQGYRGAPLYLKSYPPGAIISERDLPQDRLWLLQQGDTYFIYGPKLTGAIEATVDWKLIKLDVRLLAETLKALWFTGEGRLIKYDSKLRPVYAAVDRSLGGRLVGSGFSFDFANINYRRVAPHGVRARGAWAWTGGAGHGCLLASSNLAGLNRLDVARTAELAQELMTVKQHLPNRKEGAASERRPPSPFR